MNNRRTEVLDSGFGRRSAAALLAGGVFVAVLLMPVPCHASGQEIVQKIEAKYGSVTVMEADFVQTVRSAQFGEERRRGDVTLKRPSKMRWRFSDETQFVTDGTTLWVYTRTDNQVIVYQDLSSQASAADSVLQSLHRLSELFSVEPIETADRRSTLRLVPRDENTQVRVVVLSFDADLVVSRVTIEDAYGSVTELEFGNVRLNGNVSDSTFQFKIPEGAEVISAD